MRMEGKRMNYYIYIGATIMVLGLILLIVGVAVAKNNKQTKEVKQEITQAMEEESEEIEEDMKSEDTAAPETTAEPESTPGNETVSDKPDTKIEELIKNYYKAYASGDVKILENYAAPISELEKSYVKLMSEYTKSTENIQCHIKDGLNEGDYAVSVVADMQLEGVALTAPGLDFFYVRTNDDGAYYIDNAYSSFNTSVHVLDTDTKITDFITEYESQDDFKALQDEVQARYDEILSTNEELANKLLVEIPQVVNNWMNGLASSGYKKPEDGGDTNDVIPGAKLIANDSYNIRKSMKDDAKKVGDTKKGDEILIVKNYPNGWTEVKWKGETGFIKTKLLIENQ